MTRTITSESPLTPDLTLLFERHTEAMHADTPPESIHMLPREDLAVPEVTFLVLRENGVPLGMGALKDFGDGTAEIKSMHVLAEHRGGGRARDLLRALVDHARKAGLRRVMLETGAQESFAPARAFYLAEGFHIVGPFADYTDDPMSTYMALDLA